MQSAVEQYGNKAPNFDVRVAEFCQRATATPSANVSKRLRHELDRQSSDAPS